MKSEELKILISFLINLFNKAFFIIIKIIFFLISIKFFLCRIQI